MTLDPRDYDPSELEGVLEGTDHPGMGNGGGGDLESASPPSPEETLEAGHYRELMMLQGANGDAGKPYVERLPASYSAETVVFEWLDYLLTKAGVRRTLEAFRYYESIGWLGEPAKEQLEEHLLGLDDPAEGTDSLGREDHSLSLVYVARLAAAAD